MSSVLQASTCCPFKLKGYLMFFVSIGPNSGQQRKWRKSKDPSDLTIYQSLLSSFCAEVHNAKASYFHNKINSASDTRSLFKTFNSLLCPLLCPHQGIKVSLLPFIAKMLERVVFNQISSFLSKHNLLDANQSGFRHVHSTETALLCHWSLADCKSWFQIISPQSAGSVCHFWHC